MVPVDKMDTDDTMREVDADDTIREVDPDDTIREVDPDDTMRKVIEKIQKVAIDVNLQSNIKGNFTKFNGSGRSGYYKNIALADLPQFIETLTENERKVMKKMKFVEQGMETDWDIDIVPNNTDFKGVLISCAKNKSKVSLIISSYELEYEVAPEGCFSSAPARKQDEVKAILSNEVKKELVALAQKEL